jgi:hypothetical protein
MSDAHSWKIFDATGIGTSNIPIGGTGKLSIAVCPATSVFKTTTSWLQQPGISPFSPQGQGFFREWNKSMDANFPIQ